MTAHIHAELMAQYAQDAAETDKPWERWEWRSTNSNDSWKGLEANPKWYGYNNYRRKPRTININGHEVTEPVREPLECGAEYFAPSIGGLYFITEFYWRDDEIDNRLLERGLVHLTAEAAAAHAEALLSFTSKQETGNKQT